MSTVRCLDCVFYEPCSSEECPPEKEPHGHCFANPPKTLWAPTEDGEMELQATESVAEVFYDRRACRFFDTER